MPEPAPAGRVPPRVPHLSRTLPHPACPPVPTVLHPLLIDAVGAARACTPAGLGAAPAAYNPPKPAGGGALGMAAAALGARILLIGVERTLLRRMGQQAGDLESAAVFFTMGALFLLPFAGLPKVRDWSFLRLAIPSGLVYAVAYWLYVSSIARAEVSRIAPLGALGGVAVAVMAVWTHGESLSWLKGTGVLLVAGGALQLQRSRSLADGGRAAVVALPACMMVGYALLSAAARLLDKSGASAAAGATAGAYAFVVFTVVALAHTAVLIANGRLGGAVRLVQREPLVTAAAGVCNGGSFLTMLLALTVVPVSIVEPVTALSLLVTAVVARLWFHEPLGGRVLPTLAVVAGVWLVLFDALGGVPRALL